MQASELLALVRQSPTEALSCPCCHKRFTGSQGKPFLTDYKRPGEAEWTLGFLLYCRWECVLAINPAQGTC